MKEKTISKTIISTVGKVQCANSDTGEIFDRDFVIAKKFSNPDAIIKFLEKIYEKDVVIIRVIESETMMNLYQCSETEFMSVSQLIKTEKIS